MHELKGVLGVLIPIIAIVMGIGLAMLGLWLDHQKKSRLLEVTHAERLKALEQGRELPELPVMAITGSRREDLLLDPQRHLRRGLTWLLVGVAVGVALWLNKGPERAAFALIPMAVGLAGLITYAVRPKTPPSP
jgi:Domain of unknown function (DUF6249)